MLKKFTQISFIVFFLMLTNNFVASAQQPVLVITNPAPVCQPSTVDITMTFITAGSALPAGTTLGYYTDAGATIVLAAPNAIMYSGTYYIKATSLGGLTDIKPVIVTINPIPAITITSVNPTTCAGSDGSFTIGNLIPSATYIIGYTKGGVPQTQQNIAASTSGKITINGLVSTTYTAITATIPTGCQSFPYTVTLSDPSPPAPIAGVSAPICAGDPLILTVAPIAGATYFWTGPNGYTSTQENPTIGTTSSADSGTYIVTALLAGCAGSSAVVGNVHSLPSLSTTNPTAVSSPSTVDITAAAITTGSTLPTGTTLGYYTDPAASISVANPAAIAASGIYYIKALTTLGCSTVTPVVVTINTAPILSITNPAAVCQPGTVDITNAAVTAGSSFPGGVNLSYYKDAAATITLSNPADINTSGTYYIKATNGGGISDIAPVAVTINPTPVLIITNPTTVSSPSTVDITAPSITAGSTLPTGTTLGYYTDAAAIMVLADPAAIAVSGTYYIKALTTSGCGFTSPVVITINTAPVLVITNPAPVCQPATVNITNQTIAIDNSTLPTGTVINYYTDAAATSTLNNPEAINTSGTYYIKARTSSGTSDIKPVVVTINPTPVLIITNPATVSSPLAVDITNSAITTGSTLPTGTTLNYYEDAAGTIVLPAPMAITTSGTYYIEAITTSGCMDIKPVVVSVDNNYKVPGPASVNPNPANQTLTISINPDETGDGYFELINDKGQVAIKMSIVYSPSITIDVSSMPNGEYYYVIKKSNGKKLKMGKIIIIH